MALSSTLIAELSNKAGIDVTTPYGAAVLAQHIQDVTKEYISATTVKRLVGVLPSKVKPRVTTLKLIAEYLGYGDWREFTNTPKSSAKLAQIHIDALSGAVGVDVTTPYGAACLALDIELKTDRHIGVNTIKRLVGVLPSDSIPRSSTFEVISEYLDYSDWRSLLPGARSEAA